MRIWLEVVVSSHPNPRQTENIHAVLDELEHSFRPTVNQFDELRRVPEGQLFDHVVSLGDGQAEPVKLVAHRLWVDAKAFGDVDDGKAAFEELGPFRNIILVAGPSAPLFRWDCLRSFTVSFSERHNISGVLCRLRGETDHATLRLWRWLKVRPGRRPLP